MRTFEYRDGTSAKFWAIDLRGKRLTVRYGKIGTAGQAQTKEFADPAAARKEHDRLVAEKVGKGYVETTAGAPPAPAPAAAAPPPERKSTKRAAFRDFVCGDETPRKWWAIRLHDRQYTVAFGKDHGTYRTTDKTRTKTFPNKAKAKKEYDKVVAKKREEGYVEGASAAAATPKRRGTRLPVFRRFAYGKGVTKKYWGIALNGRHLTVESGTVRTGAKTQAMDFTDKTGAKAEYDRLVAEKLGQGYVEVVAADTPPPPPAPPRHQGPPPGPPSAGPAALDGLLAAARAEPDDDTPRLVLADWLEENGDPAWAEFIRAQCRMARLADDWGRPGAVGYWAEEPEAVAAACPEFAALAARAEALLAEHGPRWAAKLPGLPLAVGPGREEWWRRGEAARGEYVGGLKAVFSRGLPALWAHWTGGEPRDVLDALLGLSRTPAFAWVAHVGIDLSERSAGYSSEDDWRSDLARHPAFALVNELDLSWATDVARGALPDLADAGPLPALRVLGLLVEQGGGDFEALRQAANLGGLRELDVSQWENVGSYRDASPPPFAWPPFPGLRRLDLGGTCCNGADLTHLAESGHFPDLRWIDVSTSWVTPEGILALLASRRHPHLAGVQFSGARGGENEAFGPSARAEFVRRLARLRQAARLQSLRLDGVGLGDADVEPLLASPHLARLGHLDVRRNPLSPEAVKRLRARFPRVEADSTG
jgi:uncharacterized protein (TIGR02996 family)